MDPASRKCSWSYLPSELLENIANCLGRSRLHILRIRSVCRSWRCSVPLPPQPPLFPKLPYPIEPDIEDLHEDFKLDFVGQFTTLTETSVYSVKPLSGSSIKPWLMRIQSSESGILNFHDLLAVVPYWSTKPTVLNLLDYRVDEICTHYYLKIVGEEEDRSAYYPRQVAVSWSFNDGYTVMTPVSHKLDLAVWKMGDEKWIIITENTTWQGCSFKHVLYACGRFYAFTNRGLVLRIDPDSLEITE
ncbi:hypothetical protein Tsubulata_042351, partial [Turnera subulata]